MRTLLDNMGWVRDVLEHIGMRWVGFEAQGNRMGINFRYMGIASVRAQGKGID